MNSRDKNSFLILGIVIGLIALVLFFTFTSRFISPTAVAIISILIQCLLLKPIIVKQYYTLYDSHATVQRYIPILSEFMIFSKDIVISEIIIYFLMILTSLISFIPTNVLYNVMSDSSVATFPIKCFAVVLLEIAVLSIIRGIGFFRVLNDVRQKEFDLLGVTKRFKPTDLLSLIALLMPIVRILGLLYIYNYLNKVVNINGYSTSSELTTNEFEEV